MPVLGVLSAGKNDEKNDEKKNIYIPRKGSPSCALNNTNPFHITPEKGVLSRQKTMHASLNLNVSELNTCSCSCLVMPANFGSGQMGSYANGVGRI